MNKTVNWPIVLRNPSIQGYNAAIWWTTVAKLGGGGGSFEPPEPPLATDLTPIAHFIAVFVLHPIIFRMIALIVFVFL